MIYDGPPSRMLPALATTIQQQLAARARCMYLNSPTMVAGLRTLLYATGTDVQREVSRGALVLEAGTDHLVAGSFDIGRIIDALEAAAGQAVADGYAGLFATGDMTWELGAERDFSKLVEYEWRLEELFRKQPALSGICQYHRELMPLEAVREGVVSHAQLYISATLSRLNPQYVPARSPDERKAAALTVTLAES
jgi:hypothetical protein